jgi:hypothetical protein
LELGVTSPDSVISSLIFLIDQPLDSRNRERFALDFWNVYCDHILVIDMTRLNSGYEEFIRRGGIIDSGDLCMASPPNIISLLRLFYGVRSPVKRGYFLVLCDPLSVSGLVSRYILTLKGYTQITVYNGLLPTCSERKPPVELRRSLLSRFSGLVNAKLRSLCEYQSKFRKTISVAKVILMNFLESLFSLQKRLLKTTDVIVETGLRSPYFSRQADSQILRVAACSFDYDSYLRCERTMRPPIQASPYLLFLDEDMFRHVDYLRTGRKPPVSVSRYLPSFQHFVREVSGLYGCPLVVSCHPRSMYSKDDASFFFSGLWCVVGDTVNLVKHASVVIAHSSTSVNFAVLYRKKIIFLTSKELEAHSQGVLIRSMASALGCEPFDIDSFNRELLEMQSRRPINDKLYSEYEKGYIYHPNSPTSLFSYESIHRALLP